MKRIFVMIVIGAASFCFNSNAHANIINLARGQSVVIGSTTVVCQKATGQGSCNNYGCSACGACNNYGCPKCDSGYNGGSCNNYGCWDGINGSCNNYGCSNNGTCNNYGCSDNGVCNNYGCP